MKRFLILVLVVVLAGCAGYTLTPNTAPELIRDPLAVGDPEQGRQLLFSYGCGGCHTIPGIPGAHTFVGPPLTNWSQRHYIVGSLPNTTDNLVRWIMNPQGIEPSTIMPILGVTEDEAHHMAAYLYTLND